VAGTRPITLALAGDVMLGRLVNRAIALYGPAYPWGDLLPLLAQADLTVINLECVITRHTRPWRRTPKVFHFRADPIAIETLKLAGVDAVTLANNHVLDYEVEGLLEMLRLLDENNIAHAGAGANREQASQPAILTAGGWRIAVLAYTDNEPGWAARENAPGTNYAPVSMEPRNLAEIARSIQRARGEADLVIFSNHWGPNMRERPTKLFRDFAHAILDAGADVYLGHSAHIFQGIEIYQGKPLIYDAGDFVDDYAVDPVLRNDRALLFWLALDSKGMQTLDLIPCLIEACQVNRARGDELKAVAQRVQSLSAEFQTRIEAQDDRLSISLPRVG